VDHVLSLPGVIGHCLRTQIGQAGEPILNALLNGIILWRPDSGVQFPVQFLECVKDICLGTAGNLRPDGTAPLVGLPGRDDPAPASTAVSVPVRITAGLAGGVLEVDTI
jgi:hypothetical protein